jgi:tetratricopeptide (TPR) repeat protein
VCLTLTLEACDLLQPKPPPPPPEPPKQVLPCSTLPAQDLERQALTLIDKGEVTAAREDLQCALELSPGSSRATLLLEQLDADPVTYLGERYFWYTIKRNETLSKVAQQHLGSSLKFVILARYNDIDVPANLAAGTRIKIPGTKPKQAASPAPPPPPKPKPPAQPDAAALRDQALSMEQLGEFEKAYELITRAVSEDPSLDNAQADVTRIKSNLISKIEEEAYNQELHGEPEKAADTWRRVLEIDPGNIPAQLALKRLSK